MVTCNLYSHITILSDLSSAGIKVRHLTFEGLLEIHSQVSSIPKDSIRFKNRPNLDYCLETTIDRNEALVLVDKLIDMTAHHLRCLSVASGFSNHNNITAFQAADTFLRANRFQLCIPESEIGDVVLLMRDINAGKISLQNIKNWIRKHITPFPSNLQKLVESEEIESIPLDEVKDISAIATLENAASLKALRDTR